VRRRRFAGAETLLGHLPDHLKATGVCESGMLVAVHLAGLLEDCVFGDLQSFQPSPDERRIQLTEASQPGRLGTER
jgi:hypothetical protein